MKLTNFLDVHLPAIVRDNTASVNTHNNTKTMFTSGLFGGHNGTATQSQQTVVALLDGDQVRCTTLNDHKSTLNYRISDDQQQHMMIINGNVNHHQDSISSASSISPSNNNQNQIMATHLKMGGRHHLASEC